MPAYFLIASGTLRIFAGDSSLCVLVAIVALALVLRGGALALLAVVALGLVQVPVQLIALVFAVTDRSVPLFQRVEGCTLVTCGLDHTLFHLAQLALGLVMAFFAYRAYNRGA